MKITERLVELFSRVRVLDLQLQTGLGRAGAARAESCAAEIEHCQCDFKTFAQWSENIFLRNSNVPQRETASRCAADSHLWHSLLEHLESRHVGCDQKCCDRSFVRPGHWRPRHDREFVCDRRVGNIA